MNSPDDNPFADAPVWHMFKPEMTDNQIRSELKAIGVEVESIDRTKNIIWVKGQEFTPEIQNILNNWQP